MDFFRSILADDPEPETPDYHEESDTEPPSNQSPKPPEAEGDEDDDSNSNHNSSEDGTGAAGSGGLWSFGDLVKTLTTKSESVLETYRRDLKEFGTGLRKESDLFREVASRAVKELPSSIEAGTSAIDGVLKSTAEIIAQGKESLISSSGNDDSDASGRHNYSDRSRLHSRRYSRFDAQLHAIQSDSRTYCEDPDDLDDYNKWKSVFVVGHKKGEIETLVGDNGVLAGIYAKLVPSEVDDASFWFRYFYKVHKLKEQEDWRARLVKRSLSVDLEEELSWDVDDDDSGSGSGSTGNLNQQQQEEVDQVRSSSSKAQVNSDDESKPQSSKIVDENNEINATNVEEPKPSGGNVSVEDEKEEEDLDWDEIEDLGNNDEKKASHGAIPRKADLVKRLSTAVDEEDLSWDIEDDDEPIKA